MKRATQILWTTDAGRELLRREKNDRYMVIIAGANMADLAELREAIDDALADQSEKPAQCDATTPEDER